MIHIGWYNPSSKRFCYTDEKENMAGYGGYTVKVFAAPENETLEKRLQAMDEKLDALCDVPTGDVTK